jgi:hypothetical protein
MAGGPFFFAPPVTRPGLGERREAVLKEFDEAGFGWYFPGPFGRTGGVDLPVGRMRR